MFEWQPGNTPGSARYVKNGIVLARYWQNQNGEYQIAIFLPIRGGMKSTFRISWDAAAAIETHVAEWFEQVNA